MDQTIVTIRREMTLFAMVFLFSVCSIAQNSLTDNATIWASSSANNSVDKVLDNDFQTQWVSAAAFPTNYIARTDLNMLLHQTANIESSGLSHPDRLTDSDLTLLTNVNAQNGKAWFSFDYNNQQEMFFLHLKAKTTHDLRIYAFHTATDSTLIGQYSSSQNYQIVKVYIPQGQLYRLKVEADGFFQVFEISAIAHLPKESVTIDLGEIKNLGEIHTRHWAGNNSATATALYVSADTNTWTLVQQLDPNDLAINEINLPSPILARYIKVEHQLSDANYTSAYIWEVDAFEYEETTTDNNDDSYQPDNEDDVNDPSWDAYAGAMPSYTDEATITASSSAANTLPKVVDGMIQTQWVSGNPLPSNYLSRDDQNYLKGNTQLTSSSGVNLTNVTDGDHSTQAMINKSGDKAWVELDLATAKNLLKVHIKAKANSDILVYKLDDQGQKTLMTTLTTAHNYSIRDLGYWGQSYGIRLESSDDFLLFEVGTMTEAPKEFIIADFGTSKPLGVIKTRHWAGNNAATAVSLYYSQDGTQWTFVQNLEPEALGSVTTILQQQVNARYIKLEYTLKIQNHNKVYCWEIDAYDQNGEFGAMPPAVASGVTVSELLGINTIWGWGHEKFADMLQTGEGPQLHKQYASHTRFYHNLDWDLTDPDHPVDFESMGNGGGTEASWWLNWNREFQPVVDANMKLSNTIKLDNFLDSQWDDPYGSAYDYGYQLATYFGPSQGNGQLYQVEVGNEPWAYNSVTYRQILKGMAEGIRDADPAIRILPCALQAFDAQAVANTNFSNWMGDKLSSTTADLVDGLNVHTYSYATDDMGNRIGIHPESVQSTMRELLSTIHFRNRNMPGKPIYLTEWGWDSDGAGEDCTHGECVSEEAATAYASRGALMSMRLGIQQATWYFYGNFGNSKKWSRSGTTGSKASGFQKKRTFYALQSLVHHLGDQQFLEVVQEDETAWMYLMGDENGNPTHLVAWRPIDGDDASTITVDWTTGFDATDAWQLDGNSATGTQMGVPTKVNGKLQLQLSAMPIVISLSGYSQSLQMKISNVEEENSRLEKNRSEKNVYLADQSDISANIKVFPNPTADYIHVDLTTSSSPVKTELRIFKTDGTLFYQRQISDESKVVVDTQANNFSPGTYYLQLIADQELLSTEKIIVQTSL